MDNNNLSLSKISSNETKQINSFVLIDSNVEKLTQEELKTKELKSSKSTNEIICSTLHQLANEKTSSGLFNSMADGFTNFKNTLKFNLISTNKQLNLKHEKLVTINGKNYCLNNESSQNILTFLYQNFIYFSYRSGFTKINCLNDYYSTDCGWGCMIRSSQMILAKAILEAKKATYSVKELSPQIVTNIIKETVLLFSDNFLTSNDIIGNPDFNYYKIKKFFVDSSRISRVSSMFNLDIVDKDEVDEYFISKVYPPFSIQLISRMGEIYSKGAGKYFSDINCIKIFDELNAEFRPLPNLELYWTDNHITEEALVSKFLVLENVTEEGNIDDYYQYNNQYYKMKKIQSKQHSLENKLSVESDVICSGCIFISVRLGIDKISNEYLSNIQKLFEIQGFIGIIGGEENKGFYYFGCNGKGDLFFFDPHLNQQSFNGKLDLERNLHTYYPSYTYKINISKISPAFTVGFIFHSMKEFKILMYALKSQSEQKNNIFKFSKGKRISTEKTLIITEVENDYDLVDYEK